MGHEGFLNHPPPIRHRIVAAVRGALILCCLSSVALADPLESAAQALVDEGLAKWEQGDLVAARALFAHARDVLPDKPNPYRLLALIDSKLGHCPAAVLEADRFLALTPADDHRRAELEAVRAQCAPAAATSASPAPITRIAVRDRASSGRGLRIAAITSLVAGAALVVVGGSLMGTQKTSGFDAGIGITTVGGMGLAVSIPLFVVAYGR
jgi:hypothetical protein